jgi:integrase
LHSKLGSFFSWCLRNRIDTNPSGAVARPPPAKTRERVFSDEEIISVWHGAETLSPPYAAMVKLLLATGARLREVAGLRWSELNDDLSVWTLPAVRSKNRREHRLTLPPLAREIVRSVPRIADSGFVLTFTGARPDRRPQLGQVGARQGERRHRVEVSRRPPPEMVSHREMRRSSTTLSPASAATRSAHISNAWRFSVSNA